MLFHATHVLESRNIPISYDKPKGAGTPDYYPLYTALTTFYSDYFVGGLWAHLTTIHTRIFLYFAYLQG